MNDLSKFFDGDTVRLIVTNESIGDWLQISGSVHLDDQRRVQKSKNQHLHQDRRNCLLQEETI